MHLEANFCTCRRFVVAVSFGFTGREQENSSKTNFIGHLGSKISNLNIFLYRKHRRYAVLAR